jgi:hypothetical protein
MRAVTIALFSTTFLKKDPKWVLLLQVAKGPIAKGEKID